MSEWRVSRGEDQPFAMKPVAILRSSPGPLGGAHVQYDMRKDVRRMTAS